jgi:hypothetical protein
MNYIGKIWFKKPIQMKKIAEILELEDIVLHKTEDITGTMKWRGGNILVLLHLSWGDTNNAEKIRIFVHHLEDTETDEFFKLAMERFKGIAIEMSMSPQEIDNMTKREIDKLIC